MRRQHGRMSGLDRYQLKNSLLTYVAFRMSALHTFARMKSNPLPDAEDFGYLSELPLLREAAPQVQLELLADTWKRGCSARLYPPTIVDECVLHCAFQRSVRALLTEPVSSKSFLTTGPKPIDVSDLVWLPVRLRTLHLTLPLPASVTAGETVELVESGRSGGYNEVPVGPTPRDQLFEVLGRWRVNRNLAWGFDGLLTTTEILEITRFLHTNHGF